MTLWANPGAWMALQSCPDLRLEDWAFVFPHRPVIGHVPLPPANIALRQFPEMDEAVSSKQLTLPVAGGGAQLPPCQQVTAASTARSAGTDDPRFPGSS